jgi:hypothetical protein
MPPKILEKPRIERREAPFRPHHGEVAPTLRRPVVPAVLALLPPIAAAALFHAWTTALPFSLGEEAALAQHDRMPPGARALASILGTGAPAWRVFGAVVLGIFGLVVAAIAARASRSRISTAVVGTAAQARRRMLAGR